MSISIPMGRPAIRRAAAGTADQILYSVTNFIVTALVAHFSSTRDFGAYALLYATFLVGSGINRGLVCEPLIIRFSSSDDDHWHNAAQISVRRSFALGAIVGGALLTLATVAPAPFRPVGFVFAFGAPLMFAQDCLRYTAFARARPFAAVANDAAMLAIQLVASAVMIASNHTTSAVLVAVWVVSALFGSIVGTSRLRLIPRAGPLSGLGHEHRVMATRLGTDNAILLLTQQSIGYVVTGVGGLPAAASLRAGQTVYSPLSTLVLGFQSAVIPEMARASRRSVRPVLRICVVSGLALATISVLYVLLISEVPRSVGHTLLGPSWDVAKPLLLLLGFSTIFAIPTNISQAALRAIGETSRIIRARLWGIGLLALAALPLTALKHTQGAALGLAVGSFLQSLVWVAAFRSAYRKRTSRIKDGDPTSIAGVDGSEGVW